ncbi:MAG TPA: type II/IV secretion system ATPase subunit [Candidatus Nanoarchaeia archaeon]|nr:type II/IV secretion system ATPase subunit [Candidatus Nanoarchaeia archaeon]
MPSKKNQNNIEDYEKVDINFSPKIPPLKTEKDKTKIDVRYSLISPFAYAHIYWDDNENELVYDLEEPVLTEEEKEDRKNITHVMRNLINYEEIVEKGRDALLDYIHKRLKIIVIEMGLEVSYESFKKIYYYMCRDFIGFNEIDPVLNDYFVEDIECNGVNTPVYLIHRKYRNLKTNIIYNDLENLKSFVEKLAQRAKKYISYAQPILDGSLPDGSRVNATYTEDITSRGPTYTIRKFTKVPWTPTQLISFKTLNSEMMAFLWMLVKYKMSLLIAGGTASGKTTLLNAIAFFIPPEARVVSIEDTREINLPRENWLPSVSRNATGVGNLGEVGLYTLLRASFRQNPDYVIVGEVRGKEASVLFQGMASGHPSISTIHADSIGTVVKRLETRPIELSPTLMNVLDAICVMTHAIVDKQDTRKLREISEIVNVNSKGVALTNTPFKWNPQNDSFYFKSESKIFEKIQKRFGMNRNQVLNEFDSKVKLLKTLTQKKVFGFKEFQKIIMRYYKEPEKVLREYNIR